MMAHRELNLRERRPIVDMLKLISLFVRSRWKSAGMFRVAGHASGSRSCGFPAKSRRTAQESRKTAQARRLGTSTELNFNLFRA